MYVTTWPAALTEVVGVQDVVDLIYNIMDGNEPDRSALSKELLDYAKTVDVILGKTLYSDSWLEI